MKESRDFFNAGFGWVCRHCYRETLPSRQASKLSRLLNEGEAEAKHPELSTPALAKWADPARRSLMCPRCGITELIDIS